MAEKKEGISLKDKLKGSMDSLKSTVKDINIPSVDLQKVKSAFSKKENEKEPAPAETVPEVLSTKCALQVIYYLMSVDGEISAEEEERFSELGNSLDPAFSSAVQDITDECRKQIAKVIDPEDLYEVVKEGVDKAISSSEPTDDSFITPRLLLWDLLTIANIDENYDESERNLIKFIVRRLGVYNAVFLEMESTVLALADIEREIEWIKTTDRPYLVIEGMVNELEDRKQVLFTGVKDLINL